MTTATTARPVFVLARTPGAVDTVEWTDICHGQQGKRFLFISHEPARSPSRWTYAENKRPFIVYTQHWHRVGASSTLDGALKIARREA
jgi:hypothetical protein